MEASASMRYSTRSRLLLFAALILALLINGSARPARASDASTAAVHTVAWGETLGTIAQDYGVSADAIIEANHLTKPDKLYAGIQLVIPGALPAPAPAEQNATHVV